MYDTRSAFAKLDMCESERELDEAMYGFDRYFEEEREFSCECADDVAELNSWYRSIVWKYNDCLKIVCGRYAYD